MTELEIDQNTVFSFVRGSHAYGLNNAESDEDIGGVALPSRYVLAGLEEFKQKDDYVDENGEKTDKVIYNIFKAIDLLENNNPNMVDFLFAPHHCIRLLKPEWERVMSIRDSFLCKKAKWAYQGYAKNQFNRLENHRSYLLNPIKGKPNRTEFGLPENSIFPETQLGTIARLGSEYIDTGINADKFYSEMAELFDHEGALIFKKHIDGSMYPFAIADFKRRQDEYLRMIGSVSSHFLKDEFKSMAHAELKYLAALDQWVAFKRWQKTRNPKRKILEEKCGYDAKHASHCIRLMRMGVEIMEGKGVLVDRTHIDRDYLYEIRIGNVKFDVVLEEVERLNTLINKAYSENTTLPLEPDHEKIKMLKYELTDIILSK